jgi:antitoxin (DNA-binding transcriptional repressor) of toxin-antitoxin stability system
MMQEAQTQLSELVSLANAGNDVILAQNNMPLPDCSYKASAMAERIPNLHPDAMVASDDFDEPLPDSFWTGSA